jgi:hypothetical protein
MTTGLNIEKNSLQTAEKQAGLFVTNKFFQAILNETFYFVASYPRVGFKPYLQTLD